MASVSLHTKKLGANINSLPSGSKLFAKFPFAKHKYSRATEILKSKSVHSTDDVIDVIGTCVQQSQIVMKTNDSSFSSKSVSEIDYFSNTL